MHSVGVMLRYAGEEGNAFQSAEQQCSSKVLTWTADSELFYYWRTRTAEAARLKTFCKCSVLRIGEFGSTCIVVMCKNLKLNLSLLSLLCTKAKAAPWYKCLNALVHFCCPHTAHIAPSPLQRGVMGWQVPPVGIWVNAAATSAAEVIFFKIWVWKNMHF